MDPPIRTPFSLDNGSGGRIYGEMRHMPGREYEPAVIVCHSFMAFKDWGFFPYVGTRLAQAGFVSITFNFSLNGVAGEGRRITDLAAFARNTFSQELLDLELLVGAVSEETLGPGTIDRGRIALLGHSRGGGIAIVHASRDARVKSLVTWSAISTFDRWSQHQKELWKVRGYHPLGKDVHTPLRLGPGILDDLSNRPQELDIISAASRIRVPWLIIHGNSDVIVPPEEARRLFQSSGRAATEMVMLDAAGHLYDAPSEGDEYPSLDPIIRTTTEWLHRH